MARKKRTKINLTGGETGSVRMTRYANGGNVGGKE